MSKKRVLIDACGGDEWIGGLYYKRNIAYGLLNNKRFCDDYELVVASESSHSSLFEVLGDKVRFVPVNVKNKKLRLLALIATAKLNGCKFLYNSNHDFSKFGVKSIAWIPDFQHKHLPQFFDASSIEVRDAGYRALSETSIPLVLSSHDAQCDYEELYPDHRNEAHVVPFVSCVSDEVERLTPDFVESVLGKSGINGKRFAFICNQFWKHKNHSVVFKAIQEADECLPEDVRFIFTGKMEDYRNPSYIAELKVMAGTDAMKRRAVFLGFIDRSDQLALMSAAELIIQPSLFEGWGTVVEDSKVLDKTVLLSDIPVHREQKSEKCRLFDPTSSDELASLVVEEFGKTHESNIPRGIADAAERSARYSDSFVDLLDSFFKKGRS